MSEKLKIGKPKRTEMVPLALAVASLIVIMGILLAVNYRSQQADQEKNLQEIQADAFERGQQFTIIIDRLHENLTQLAGSNEVTAFFRNRALGMSMNYGLRASLNNIRRYFQNTTELSHLGGGRLYTEIALIDVSGTHLAQWPESHLKSVPMAPDRAGGQVQMHSQGRFLYLSLPVYNGDALQGYVRSSVAWKTLHDYLFGAQNRHFAIAYRDCLVSLEGEILAPGQTLSGSNKKNMQEITSPYRGDPLNLELYSPWKSSGIKDPLVFFSDLEAYPFSIYRLEDGAEVYSRTAPIILLLTLLFSATVIIFSIRLVRSSTRNQILNMSLLEVEKREAVLADKNQEMEMIITGAELGTWLWDAQSGDVTINAQWANMLGYEEGEIVATIDLWRSLIHQDDHDLVENALSDHLSGKTHIYEVDHRLRHKSGKWVWIHDVGQVLSRDEDGAPLLVRGIHLDITELKEALLQTKQAQQEADSVIANFLDSLLVVDRDLHITRINNATCTLLGYTEDELLGKDVKTLFWEPESVIEQYFGFPALPDYEQTQKLRNIELSFLDCKGIGHPVSINLARLKNDQGETVGVVAGAKDISALKRALEKTEKQKLFIENILNIIPGGLLVLGVDSTLLQRNHTFNNLLKSWSENYRLTKEQLSQEILSSLVQNIVHGCNGEFCIHSPGGELYIEYHASGCIEDSEVNRVIFLHDVTDRHHVVAAQRLQATVLEQSSEAVIATDTDGVILYANNAAKELSGYPDSEMLGQKTSLFKSGVHDQSYYQKLWEPLLAGKLWRGSLTNKKKNGSLFEVASSITPVRDDLGKVTHFVSLWRDVSQEHALQRQLLQAQKLEAVGQLAAGVAHEINTPIQYIQNNVTFFQSSFVGIDILLDDLQKMLKSPESETTSQEWKQLTQRHAEEYDLDFLREEIPLGLKDILEGIDHVAKIVSAMKEFSHPGGAEKVPTDLNRIIESTAVVTRNEWKYVAELKTDLDADLPLLSCDPGAWSQVLLNLIVNSAQAIGENTALTQPGQILLMTRTVDREIEITISDNGAGIKPENQSRIFEPFFTTKEVGKGTGQGLAIVYDLVASKHDGSIVCNSKPGEGTVFTIRIPLNAQQD